MRIVKISYTHMQSHTCTHILAHAPHARARTHMHTYLRVRAHTHLRAHTHACAYTYEHMYAHTCSTAGGGTPHPGPCGRARVKTEVPGRWDDTGCGW